MAQTFKSVLLAPNESVLLLEKPHILHRVFFSICCLSEYVGKWSKISFDDPQFLSFYLLRGGSKNYFEAKGVDIFQGDIWVQNFSETENTWYTSTEVLAG